MFYEMETIGLPDYVKTTHTVIEGGVCYQVDTYLDGTINYFLNGELHREDDLPAILNSDGSQQWWSHDKLHRLKGPACNYLHGEYLEWWYHGEHLEDITTQAEYEQWLKLRVFT